MAQAICNINMDENRKRQLDMFCTDFGMNARSVISNEFMRTNGRKAFMELRTEAKKNGVQDLTLDEINDEIRQVRYGENE